jgi:osmotically-inducible protein OsmY
VQQGRATLDGEVEWNFQRTSAEEDVRKLRGIVGILNYITLKPRVDAGDVTRGIADALQRSAGVEARRINITAQDGKVRIEGSVNTWSEREVIEHAVWSAPGVTAVEDRLHVLVT